MLSMPFVPFNPTTNKKNTNVTEKENLVPDIKKRKKCKIGNTQKRKLDQSKKTKRVKFNLASNSINKYYCPDLQPSWLNKIESAEPMTGEFKVKKVPSISLKELFDN
jgi:hypothetical protein